MGRVVRAIIREFEKFPPALWTSEQPQQMASTNTQHHLQSHHQPQQHHSPHRGQQHHPTTTISSIQSSIPELCNLTLDDLQRLHDDPDYLNDFVEEMSIVRKFNDDLDRLIVDMETIARDNIGQETRIEELRTRLGAKLTEFVMHGEKYEALNQRYQKKSEEFAPQHIKELLQIAASTADGICETHVDQFLNGSIDVQAFLDRYLQAKKLSALRKAKEEQLTRQLNELERATF